MGSVQQPEVIPASREILRVYTKRQRKPAVDVDIGEADVAENLVFMATQGGDVKAIMAEVGELFNKAAEEDMLQDEMKRKSLEDQQELDRIVEKKISLDEGPEQLKSVNSEDKLIDEHNAGNEDHAKTSDHRGAKADEGDSDKMVVAGGSGDDGKQVHEIIPSRANKVQIGYQRRHKRPLDTSSVPQKASGGQKSSKRLRREDPNASLSDVMNADRNSDHREHGREVTSLKEKTASSPRTKRNAPKRTRSASKATKSQRWTRPRHKEIEESDNDEEEDLSLSNHQTLDKTQALGLSDGVSRWLDTLGLLKYAENFERHEVEDVVLPLLTFEDLREMGITAVGARRKMFTAIQEMEKKKLL